MVEMDATNIFNYQLKYSIFKNFTSYINYYLWLNKKLTRGDSTVFLWENYNGYFIALS